MHLFTKAQSGQLIRNSQPDETGKDHFPVVKLYLPKTGYTWLFTEIDMANPFRFYGLSVYEIDVVNVGYTDYSEVTGLQNSIGETVKNDLYFIARYPLSVYVSAAFSLGFVTEVEPVLERHSRLLKPPGHSPS